MTTPLLQQLPVLVEIQELILLQVDRPTLLVSVQRVCRQWYNLIRYSRKLQEYLFLTPVRKPQENPERNPFFTNHLWNNFLHKRIQSLKQPVYCGMEDFDFMDPWEEAIYLRPEASWRRMLLQQTRDFNIAVIKIDPITRRGAKLAVTQFKIQRIVLIDEIARAVHAGILIPHQDPFEFYLEPLHSSWIRRIFAQHPWLETLYHNLPQVFSDCVIRVFTCRSVSLSGFGREAGLGDKFEMWLESIGSAQIVQKLNIEQSEFDGPGSSG